MTSKKQTNDLDQLAATLATTLTGDEFIRLVIAVDTLKSDWEVTMDLYEYFADERDDLRDLNELAKEKKEEYMSQYPQPRTIVGR